MKITLRNLAVPFICLAAIISIVSCAPKSTSPTSGASGATTPAVATISQTDLVLIQTGATIATGAVLQFVETDATQRTQLANQIYASANAANSLSTGTVPSAAQINSTILSFAGSNPAANYTQYAQSISALYASYFSKIGTSGKNAVAVLQAIAAGAQSAAAAYISTPAPAA